MGGGEELHHAVTAPAMAHTALQATNSSNDDDDDTNSMKREHSSVYRAPHPGLRVLILPMAALALGAAKLGHSPRADYEGSPHQHH